jgi:hypothetical protein
MSDLESMRELERELDREFTHESGLNDPHMSEYGKQIDPKREPECGHLQNARPYAKAMPFTVRNQARQSGLASQGYYYPIDPMILARYLQLSLRKECPTVECEPETPAMPIGIDPTKTPAHYVSVSFYFNDVLTILSVFKSMDFPGSLVLITASPEVAPTWRNVIGELADCVFTYIKMHPHVLY